MAEDKAEDYYELLQISSGAEPETISRVYRLLAQRYHPDNRETGNEDRFRMILEAYTVLSDPEKRARYDIAHQRQKSDRWRLIASGENSENDFEREQIIRLTVLEALYAKRRLDSTSPGIPFREFEKLTGMPREHLEFTMWYLQQKKFVVYDDRTRLHITVEGAEYLEQSYRSNLQQKRLPAKTER